MSRPNKQIFAERQSRKTETVVVSEKVEQNLGRTALGEELKKDLDELLDEIDEILQENAEQFVSEYVQGNGQ